MLLLTLFASANGQLVPFLIDSTESSVSYTGYHMFHNWMATSNSVKGIVEIDMDDLTRSEISLEIPVLSFNSGNSNRDSNMAYYVNEYDHPHFSFQAIEILQLANSQKYQIKGSMSINGVTRDIKVPVTISISEHQITGKAEFELTLSEFEVERPALLMVPVEDRVTIKVHLSGNVSQNK